MEMITCSNGTVIPLSPYNLVQEIYISSPWKIMVCCMLLNCTRRVQVDGIREELFQRWPTPELMANADQEMLAELLKPLGFYNKRSKSLIKFSREWTDKEWKSPNELHGIGKYAQDSWEMFVNGNLVEDPADHVLNRYYDWRKQQTQA